MPEAQDFGLLIPAGWNLSHAQQAFGSDIDRLCTAENCVNNSGREKSQWQLAADFAGGDGFGFGNIFDRCDRSGFQAFKPGVSFGDGVDEIGIDIVVSAATPTNDQPGFNTTPFHLQGDGEQMSFTIIARRQCRRDYNAQSPSQNFSKDYKSFAT